MGVRYRGSDITLLHSYLRMMGIYAHHYHQLYVEILLWTRYTHMVSIPDNASKSDASGGETREPAVVEETPDGEPVGVAVYLTADDLRKLGLIPDGVNALVPVIQNGVIRLEPVR